MKLFFIIKKTLSLCFLFLMIISCEEAKKIKQELKNPYAGGEGSVSLVSSESFSLPNRNIGKKNKIDFIVGNAFFKENWVPSPSSVESRQGLGPLINANSCSSCHFKDGRGEPPKSYDESPVSLLLRISVPGQDNVTGDVIPVPHYGDQIQHRAIFGVRAEASVHVRYKEISGMYPDGTSYSLLKPDYDIKNLKLGELPNDIRVSPRIAPQVIGLGLLEAIDEKDILKNADPQDLNNDGISGKPNFVWDFKSKEKKLGRFGWKANQPSVMQQTAGAFAGDMGITSSLFPQKNCASIDRDCNNAHQIPKNEISDENLRKVVVYSKTLAVPMRRNLNDSNVLSGAKSFYKLGCAQCHVSSFTTGVDLDFPENSNQKIFPYTDLLLHDMGAELADNRNDFDANGREWRTPPLWGIGLIKTVNGHTRLLHDGRARSIEEAILWHGGESENSKNKFMELSKLDRSHLILFLESI